MSGPARRARASTAPSSCRAGTGRPGLAVARAVRARSAAGAVAASQTGSSWLAADPTVSARMSYDGDPATSWIADPGDRPADLPSSCRSGGAAPIEVTAPPTSAPARPGRCAGRGEVRVVDLNGEGHFEPLTRAEGHRHVRPTGRRRLHPRRGRPATPVGRDFGAPRRGGTHRFRLRLRAAAGGRRGPVPDPGGRLYR